MLLLHFFQNVDILPIINENGSTSSNDSAQKPPDETTSIPSDAGAEAENAGEGDAANAAEPTPAPAPAPAEENHGSEEEEEEGTDEDEIKPYVITTVG